MTETLSESQRRIALVMVLINAFTTPLMLSAVNVALPHIATDLALDAVVLSWIPMAYLMASAMFLFLFGRLADVYGRKRIFLIGTTMVVVTSLYASITSNGTELLIARFAQGVSAAMLYATQVAIVSSIYPPQKRGHVVGMTVSMIYLGLCFGPLLGGFLIDGFGWRSAFLLHIPLAVIVIILGVFIVDGDWHGVKDTKIDFTSAIIYAAGIACLCYSVTELPNPKAIVSMILCLLLFAWFIKLQYSVATPLLDVRLLFSNRIFQFSCAASLIIYTATFANVVLVSLYLQYLKDFSATVAGMIMMIQPLVMAIFSPLTGKLSDKLEPRYISTTGMALTLIGLVLLSLLTEDSVLIYLIMALALTGLGFSLFSPPNVNAIMSSVEKRYFGSATAVLATMRIVGQLSSMILVAMIFSIVLGNVEISEQYYPELERSIRTCFTIAASLCVIGMLFSYYRGEMHQKPSD